MKKEVESEYEPRYNWEKKLVKLGISNDKIKELRRLVNDKITKAKIKEWAAIIIYSLSVALLLVLIGILNLLKMEISLRVSLITGIIAFELAIFTFMSPIQVSGITKEEVNKILEELVTMDIMEEIHKSMERKTSRIDKWFAVIGACGVLATVILKLTN